MWIRHGHKSYKSCRLKFYKPHACTVWCIHVCIIKTYGVCVRAHVRVCLHPLLINDCASLQLLLNRCAVHRHAKQPLCHDFRYYTLFCTFCIHNFMWSSHCLPSNRIHDMPVLYHMHELCRHNFQYIKRCIFVDIGSSVVHFISFGGELFGVYCFITQAHILSWW